MKHRHHHIILVIMCLITCMIQGKLWAQPIPSNKQSQISANLLSPFTGTISLFYERKLSDDEAIVLNGYFFSGQFFGQQAPVRGICGSLEYKYYITDDFPRGVFLQPFIRLARFWSIKNVAEDELTVSAIGLLIGKQIVLKDRITFQCFAGPYYAIPLSNRQEVKGVNLVSGGWLRSGLTIGLLLK